MIQDEVSISAQGSQQVPGSPKVNVSEDAENFVMGKADEDLLFCCLHCGKGYPNETVLNDHIKRKHKGKVLLIGAELYRRFQ